MLEGKSVDLFHVGGKKNKDTTGVILHMEGKLF